MSGEAAQPATFDDGRCAAPAAHGNSTDRNWVLQAPAVWRSGAHPKGKSRVCLSFLVFFIRVPSEPAVSREVA